MSADTQLLEILIARDDVDLKGQPTNDSEESDALLAEVPERAAASFSIGQTRVLQGLSKKGILKKGEALRRASAGPEPTSSPGTYTVCLCSLCYRLMSVRRLTTRNQEWKHSMMPSSGAETSAGLREQYMLHGRPCIDRRSNCCECSYCSSSAFSLQGTTLINAWSDARKISLLTLQMQTLHLHHNQN